MHSYHDKGARQVADKVLSSLGGVDILVNNAGCTKTVAGWTPHRTKEQTKYIKQIAVFPEYDAYTFVYYGNLTLDGQRISTVAELIVNQGTTNQIQDKILALFLRKVVM